jgi:hypothetical protein
VNGVSSLQASDNPYRRDRATKLRRSTPTILAGDSRSGARAPGDGASCGRIFDHLIRPPAHGRDVRVTTPRFSRCNSRVLPTPRVASFCARWLSFCTAAPLRGPSGFLVDRLRFDGFVFPSPELPSTLRLAPSCRRLACRLRFQSSNSNICRRARPGSYPSMAQDRGPPGIWSGGHTVEAAVWCPVPHSAGSATSGLAGILLMLPAHEA